MSSVRMGDVELAFGQFHLLVDEGSRMRPAEAVVESKSLACRVIGNAVPPLLYQRVVAEVLS